MADSDAVPAAGPITAVTVVTDDLARSQRAYVDLLGYRVEAEGRIDEALATAWRAPRTSGAPWVQVGPASAVGGSVRLLEGPVPASYRPARTYGWGALEVCVPDVDDLAQRLHGTDFRILVPPAGLGGLAAPVLRAMQCVGPSGELVYFTQISGQLPAFDLPESSGEIDGVFIAVIAASDLVGSRTWLEGQLGVRRASDRRVAVKVINLAFDLPPQTLHRISSVQLRGRTAIEHDQYPAAATPRPSVAGHLPPGVACVTVAGGGEPDRQGGGHQLLIGPDGLRLEISYG